MLSALSCALLGCKETPPSVDVIAHAIELEAWQADRYEALMETDGWLTLVALHWLDPGATTFGSALGNGLVYEGPETPALIGTFHLDRGLVAWESAKGVRVTTVGGEQDVSYATMNAEDAAPIVLEAWPLQWLVIRRGERLAVRLKDAESMVRTEFDGIQYFPVLADWKLPAQFEAHEPPDTLLVPDILGSVNRTPSPGRVTFEIEGETHTLDLWRDSEDPDNFFTAFGDETNGTSSYEGGRFLWVDAPDDDGRTWVDFNKSYNPPCVFTEFATCSLPPHQNRIPAAITAGELVYGDGH
jgi:uncharacterized protein (DUF1684 family)